MQLKSRKYLLSICRVFGHCFIHIKHIDWLPIFLLFFFNNISPSSLYFDLIIYSQLKNIEIWINNSKHGNVDPYKLYSSSSCCPSIALYISFNLQLPCIDSESPSLFITSCKFIFFLTGVLESNMILRKERKTEKHTAVQC